jgi:hypothetical protein
MQVTISIKKDNGETIEITKEVVEQTIADIIESVEQQVNSIKTQCFPLITEKLIEGHQQTFKGEKNQEKERD